MFATWENPDINPYPEGFVRPKLKDAEKGKWEIKNFQVTNEGLGLENLRMVRDGYPHRVIPPASYVKLAHETRGVVMSDTPAEAWEHQDALLAKGRVLVAGLGVGLVAGSLAAKDDVSEVVVVEIDQDVIDLVGPYYHDNPKITIVKGDIFDYLSSPAGAFDFAWFDIWDSITGDNLDEMACLIQKADRLGIGSAAWGQRHMASDQLLEDDWIDAFGEDPYEWLSYSEDLLEMQLGRIWSYADQSPRGEGLF